MSNKSAKNKLIQLYGSECFIEKLHLRHDTEPRHYTRKTQMKKMKQLTYHHIIEKRNGGQTTVENGALLSVENHQWFNEQSPEIQRKLNKKFQEYKKCKVIIEDITPILEIKIAEVIPTETEIKFNIYEDMTPEEIEIYKQHKQKRNERVFKKFEKER